MEIVIKIPEEVYEYAKKYNAFSMLALREICMCMNAVANGTPLPVHHGDLIERRCGHNVCNGCEHSDICDTYNAPTIIEADRR